MICRLLPLAMVLCSCLALAQRATDYDYIYEDFVGTPDFKQPVPQAPLVQSRTRQPSPGPAPQQRRQGQTAARLVAQQAGGPLDAETTTFVPILRDIRRTDPVTGAFIYDYLGADGSGKYEVRFLNGTVIGNFTYINDVGERETRWYSAGERGTEISGDSVISPAPPTLVDETTGANYVDLSNYELYRHLEVPYVHIAGPSDPDERGQISNPGSERQQQSQVPLDFGDPSHFGGQLPQAPAAHVQQAVASEPPRQTSSQRANRVSRTRTIVQQPAIPAQFRSAQFNPSSLDTRSPNHVLDSLISQFQ